MNETNYFTDYSLTCHVEGCGNCDIPIPLNAPTENVSFMCGVCATEITDVIPLNGEAPQP
jgi:hypothetical protein